MSTSRSQVRYRPTASLVRAVFLAAGTSILAVLAGRPELIVLAAPFIVWSVLAVVRRPPTGEAAPTIDVSSRAIGAGEAVQLTAAASVPDRVVDVALAQDARVDFDPVWGSTTDAERASVKIRPRRWGRLDLADAQLTLFDTWGMWTTDHRVPVGSIEVSPTATVPGRGDTIPHPIGTAGIHQSRRPGDGSALADIRRYVPGDRLNRINWRVTSRTRQLHTNATTADRDTDVLLVIDTLSDVTTAEVSGAPHASSLDATVIAAASLAEHYLRLGDRVAVHDLGTLVGNLPARSGVRQFAVLTARLGKARVDGARDRTLHPVARLRPGTFAVVCTPLLEESVIDEIAVLARRGATVLVVDTLPARLGILEQGALDRSGPFARLINPAPSVSLWEEAWVLRRLERERDVARLRAVGIPVAAWRGVAGVAALAAALAAQRPGGRMAGGGAR